MTRSSFLINHPDQLILDEIQYVPELFPYLKIKIDEMRFETLEQKDKRENVYFFYQDRRLIILCRMSANHWLVD